MRGLHKTMTALLLAGSLLILPGCQTHRFHSHHTDELAEAAIEGMDPEILAFNGYREESDVTIYTFSVQDVNSDKIDDCVTQIYDAANSKLGSDGYIDKKISISIMSYRHERYGSGDIVSFRNYDEYQPTVVYDDISFIDVEGIDDKTKEYDAGRNYELNSIDYWDHFSDTKLISFSHAIDDDGLPESLSSETDALTMYLEEECGSYADLDEITIGRSRGEPVIEYEIRIYDERRSEATVELLEAVRHRLNDYYSDHAGDELVIYRAIVSFTLNSDMTEHPVPVWGRTSNFSYDFDVSMDAFYAVSYYNVPYEELTQLHDVVILNVPGRDPKEVRTVIDSLEGIEYVFVNDEEFIQQYSSEYPETEFR